MVAKREKRLQNMEELSLMCEELAAGRWGRSFLKVSRPPKGPLPLDRNLCSNVAELIRNLSDTSASAVKALDEVAKAFPDGQDGCSLPDRLLNFMTCGVASASQQGSMEMDDILCATDLLDAYLVARAEAGLQVEKPSQCADITQNLLQVMLSGLEYLFETDQDTAILKPLRDLLCRKPLIQNLHPASCNVVKDRLQARSTRRQRPTENWLYAAGNFVTEVLEDVAQIFKPDKHDLEQLHKWKQELLLRWQQERGEEIEALPSNASAGTSKGVRRKRAISPNVKEAQCMPMRTAMAAANASLKGAAEANAVTPEMVNVPLDALLDILISMAGSGKKCIDKLMVLVRGEFLHLRVDPGTSRSSDVAASQGRIDFCARVINAILGRDATVRDTIAGQLASDLLCCMFDSVDFPDESRRSVCPLKDLLMTKHLIVPGAAELMRVSDTTPPTEKSQIYAATVLAAEMESNLSKLSLDQDAKKIFHQVQRVRWSGSAQLDWMKQQGLTKMESDSKQALTGRQLTAEHKQKISAALMRARNPMYGRPLTEEHKQRISASMSEERLVPSLHAASPHNSRAGREQASVSGASEFSQDDSEDIPSASSDFTGSEDEGSDLEGFIEPTLEYGLARRVQDDSTCTEKEACLEEFNSVKVFQSLELVDDYQEKYNELHKTLPEDGPTPSRMAELNAKRRRLSIGA